MAKRKEPEEESSGYSWMDTYGDMVTLILCFFVLLYSFSSVDAGKWHELVGAFKGTYQAGEIETFDVTTAREEPISTIDPMVNYANRNTQTNNVTEEINQSFDKLYQQIQSYISDNGLQGSLSVSRTDKEIYLRFNEMALFNSGQADILPQSQTTLSHIMQIIHLNLDAIQAIRIEGHTDDVPMHSAEFSDNWDLSAKRATNTLRILLNSGLFPPEMLSAVGYGEYQPVVGNETAQQRAQNRRVDFVLVKVDTES